MTKEDNSQLLREIAKVMHDREIRIYQVCQVPKFVSLLGSAYVNNHPEKIPVSGPKGSLQEGYSYGLVKSNGNIRNLRDLFSIVEKGEEYRASLSYLSEEKIECISPVDIPEGQNVEFDFKTGIYTLAAHREFTIRGIHVHPSFIRTISEPILKMSYEMFLDRIYYKPKHIVDLVQKILTGDSEPHDDNGEDSFAV